MLNINQKVRYILLFLLFILNLVCSSEEIREEPVQSSRKTEIFQKVKDKNNNYIKRNLNDTFVILSEDNQILTSEYDFIQDLEGSYIVKLEDKFGLLSGKGQTLSNPKYSQLEYLGDGLFKYESMKKWGILSSSKIITNPTFEDIQIFKDNFLKVVQNNKTGLLDFSGNKLIPVDFDSIEAYGDNYFLVSKNRDFGLYSDSGKIVIPVSFDEIKVFNDTLNLVNLNGDFGLYNFSGNEIIPPRYQSIEINEDEFIVVQKKSKYGLLNKEGKAISKVNLQQIGKYREPYLSIKINNLWGLLDRKGKYFLEPKYENEIYIENYNNKFYKLVLIEYSNYIDSDEQRATERNGVLDLAGNIVIPPNFQSLEFENIGNEVYKMREYGSSEGEYRLGLVNMNIKSYIQPSFTNLSYLGDGYFKTEVRYYNGNNEENKNFGIININFNPIKVISDTSYSEIEYAGNNLFLVCLNYSKCGIINNSSEIILPLAFEDFLYNTIESDLIPVKQNEKWGFVDKTGKMKIFNKYEDANVFQNGVAPVKNNNKWGFIDKKGKVIVRLKYDNVGTKYGNFFEVSINNLWGMVDQNGKPYIEIEHDSIDVNLIEDNVVLKKGNKTKILKFSDLKTIGSDFAEVQGFIAGKSIYKEETDQGDLFGLINKNGQIILKAKYTNLKYINNDLYAFQKDDKWGIINNEGKVILKPTFTEIQEFSDNYSVVTIGDNYGLIDTSGKLRLSVEYPLIQPFSNQKALVKEKESESCFIIDIKLKRLNDYCSLSNESRFMDGFILDSAALRGGR